MELGRLELEPKTNSFRLLPAQASSIERFVCRANESLRRSERDLASLVGPHPTRYWAFVGGGAIHARRPRDCQEQVKRTQSAGPRLACSGKARRRTHLATNPEAAWPGNLGREEV